MWQTRSFLDIQRGSHFKVVQESRDYKEPCKIKIITKNSAGVRFMGALVCLFVSQFLQFLVERKQKSVGVDYQVRQA